MTTVKQQAEIYRFLRKVMVTSINGDESILNELENLMKEHKINTEKLFDDAFLNVMDILMINGENK